MAACQSPQQKAEKRAQSILKQLTLEEKASLKGEYSLLYGGSSASLKALSYKF